MSRHGQADAMVSSTKNAAKSTNNISDNEFRKNENLFSRYVETMRDPVDAALLAPLVSFSAPEEARYLYRPLMDFIAAGGKRVRPALVCLAAQLCGKNPFNALQLASSVEFFQAAALIHDDIADNSQLRRGKPCLHCTEGIGMALNQGDLALIESFSAIASDEKIADACARALMQELTTMQRHTAEGQALDLAWVREGKWDVTVEDYLRMATLKTAWYSVASPLVLGALFAGASSKVCEALRNFGLAVGQAFQIRDDFLNLKGDAHTQGKDFCSDITEGKRTFFSAYALEHADEADKNELIALLSAHTTDATDMKRAVELIEKTGAFAQAERSIEALVERAQTILASVCGMLAGNTGKAAEEMQAEVQAEGQVETRGEVKTEAQEEAQAEAQKTLQSLASYCTQRAY